MGRYGYCSYFPRQMTKWEKAEKAAKAKRDELVKRSVGKIYSLMALAQGKLPEDLLADFCNHETGLFPKPSEISFDCSCPDGASCWRK